MLIVRDEAYDVDGNFISLLLYETYNMYKMILCWRNEMHFLLEVSDIVLILHLQILDLWYIGVKNKNETLLITTFHEKSYSLSYLIWFLFEQFRNQRQPVTI